MKSTLNQMKRLFMTICSLIFNIITLFIYIQSNLYSAEQNPNIIIITLDTVRADHIAFYGYKKIQTPAIDQLAKTSSTFINAYTPSPMTLPAHASLLTGLYPQTHSVHDNDIFQLRKSIMTLPEFLKKRNYTTAAFVSSIILNSYYGLNQGFDLYDDLSEFSSSTNNLIERQADSTTNAVCKWIKKSHPPFLLWVHYFDPHYPYHPPSPFAEKYASNLYDGEIAYTDSSLANLINCISKIYQLNNSIIVIAGDHGEGLFDHDEEKHGIFLYNPTVKIPLIIKIPNAKPSIIQYNVSLIDILPTILDYLYIPIPEYIEGKSLLQIIKNPDANSAYLSSRALFLETFMPFYTYRWSHLFALIFNNLKFVQAPSPELYDLQNDVKESHNIYNDQINIAKSLQSKLNNFFNKPLINPWDIKHFYSSSESDATVKEKLKSLGYASTAPTIHIPSTLPDPKNMVYLLKKLNMAQDLYDKSLFNEAYAILEEIITKDNNNGPALSLISDCLINMNKYEQALDYLNKAINLYPNNDSLLISAATIYKKINKFKEAESFLNKSISINPNNLKAYASLINLYTSQNDMVQASKLITELNNKNINSADIYFAKAFYLIKQQNLKEAKDMLEKGLALDANNANAEANLAKIYYLNNQIDKAISLWEKYLTKVPENAEITAFLGSIYWNNKHDKSKAQQLLTKALQLNPNHPQADQWLSLLSSIKNSK